MNVLDRIKDNLRKHFGIGMGPVPRFNQTVHSNVKPPDKKRRSEVRSAYKFRRRAALRSGCPILTGERLRKTVSNCHPSNLTVKPRYARQ